MTTEEKARAYDDLLVKLQEAKVDNNVCDDRYCCVIDDIVPELKESEDEKIRKEIIEFVKSRGGFKQEYIAWLEKQGKQKYTQRDIDDAYLKGIADVKREVEKIDEQTEKMKKEIAEFIFNSKEDIKQRYEWIKCLGFDVKFSNEKKQDEQKLAWSEEDDRMLDKCIKAACSNYYPGISSVRDWLNSLKNRYTWKPSEGQLECLGYAIEKAEKDWSPLTNNRIYLTLKALKEQLEKLQ